MSRLVFIIIAIALVVIWGSAFTMIDVAVRSLSPIWLVAGRIFLAALMITAYIYLKGLRLPALRDQRWLWYAVMGMIGMVLPFFLISVGQKTIESGLSAILIGAMPLMTIILAHFFTEERMTLIKLIGFVIGFGGLIVLFFPKDFSFGLVSDWKAQSLILASALCYALATIIAKRAPQTNSSVAAAMMLICGTVFSVLWALIEGVPQTPPDPIALWMLLGLAVGSTGIATILYLYMIEVKGPTIMATINYFVPVASVIFGVWLLDEKITLQIIIAFFTIVTGVIISRIKTAPKN